MKAFVIVGMTILAGYSGYKIGLHNGEKISDARHRDIDQQGLADAYFAGMEDGIKQANDVCKINMFFKEGMNNE